MSKKAADDEKEDSPSGFLLSPLYGTIVMIVGVFVGGLGSLFSSEIRSAFPFYWGEGPIVAEAAFFWLGLAVFALLFFKRQFVTDKALENSQNELVDKAQELRDLVRTLPPKGFLAEATLAYEVSRSAFIEVIEAGDVIQDDFENAIRIVLNNIVNLAKYFDGNPDGPVYGANIMLYLPFDDLNAAEINDVCSRLIFVEPDFDKRKLRGALLLYKRFSASSLGGGSDPDKNVSEIALPVPNDFYSPSIDGRFRVIPGAPFAAFINKRMSAFSNTENLFKWCEEEGDFSPGLISQIRKYFSGDAGRAVGSFFSMALRFDPREIQETIPCPIGVLNIHRDAQGLLDDELQAELFLPIMTPFLYLLADFLREWLVQYGDQWKVDLKAAGEDDKHGRDDNAQEK